MSNLRPFRPCPRFLRTRRRPDRRDCRGVPMSSRLVLGGPALLLAICVLTVQAQDPTPAAPNAVVTRVVTPEQPDAQRKLQGETEQVARRLGTMLRFVAYHRIDKGEEQKLLAAAAKTLTGLSRNEMEAVIVHLENSIKAPDDVSASTEAKKAYDRHRDVVKNLKGLLLKYDTIKTLDQAAERLERAARDQNELRLNAIALSQQEREGRVRGRGAVESSTEQADAQGDLNRDLDSLFKQLEKLPVFLTAEQKARLAASQATEKGKKIQQVQTLAARHLTQNEPNAAAPHQQKASDQLLELAHALRSPKDKLDTLKEARAKVDKALQAQDKLTEETANPPPATIRRGSQIGKVTRHARDMIEMQARVEIDG